MLIPTWVTGTLIEVQQQDVRSWETPMIDAWSNTEYFWKLRVHKKVINDMSLSQAWDRNGKELKTPCLFLYQNPREKSSGMSVPTTKRVLEKRRSFSAVRHSRRCYLQPPSTKSWARWRLGRVPKPRNLWTWSCCWFSSKQSHCLALFWYERYMLIVDVKTIESPFYW